MTGIIIAVAIIVGWAVLSNITEKSKGEEAEARRLQSLELQRIAERERLDRLTSKYGVDIARKLINEDYFIGMTKQQLLDSKQRQPDAVETQQLKTKTKEVWVYGNKSSGDWFVFEDGKAVKITDRPD